MIGFASRLGSLALASADDVDDDAFVVRFDVEGRCRHVQAFRGYQLVSWSATGVRREPNLVLSHKSDEASWAFCCGRLPADVALAETRILEGDGSLGSVPPLDALADPRFEQLPPTPNMTLLWQQQLTATPFGDFTQWMKWQDGVRVASGVGECPQADVSVSLRYKEAMQLRNGDIMPAEALAAAGNATGDITKLMMLSGFVQGPRLRALWDSLSQAGPLLGELGIAYSAPAYRSLIRGLPG